MRLKHTLVASVVTAFVVACGVQVDIENKACPCGDGYVCDTTRDVCLRPGSRAATATSPVCDPCPCSTSGDCKDPTRPVCAPTTKACVECDPNDDKCGDGRYCNAKFQCTVGCRTSEACAKLSPSSPFCAPERRQCVTCLSSDTCGGGKSCSPSGTCVESCDATKKCPAGQDCCGGLCTDVASDALNCGRCNGACSSENGSAQCREGLCKSDCADGFAHCGPDANSGCETPIRTDPANCGACGKACAATVQHATGVACAAGKCLATACEKGFADSDNNAENGCETPCGAKNQTCCANNACNGGFNCRDGKCSTSGSGGGDDDDDNN